MNTIFKIQNFFNQFLLPYLTKERVAFLKTAALIVSLAFLSALIFISFISASLVKQIRPQIKESSVRRGAQSDLPSPTLVLIKNIVARNIFNKSGEIPYEDTPEGSKNSLIENFDRVACTPGGKLPVELLGIIYTSNPQTTLVTLKDSTVSFADVYRVGESIVGYESYSVYKVTSPRTVQFREGNKKICLSLAPVQQQPRSSPQGGENYTLSYAYVTEELGPGFSKILSSARLVPEITNDKALGFKIFAISSGSLFDKIKLESGDIITNVNGINLEDASQGFKVYEAFQEDSEITLQIIRNGNVVTKKVTVQ